MQSLNAPSFFRSITILAAYGLELILTTFFANTVRNCSQSFDFNASGVGLDRMLTGGLSPVFIKCLTSIARPQFSFFVRKEILLL